MPVTSLQQTKSITHAMCSDVGDDPVLNKLIFFYKEIVHSYRGSHKSETRRLIPGNLQSLRKDVFFPITWQVLAGGCWLTLGETTHKGGDAPKM